MIELALLLSGVIVSGGIMARRASRPAATVKVVRVASKRWSARRAAARRIKPTRIPFEPVREPKPRKARSSSARSAQPDWTLPAGVQGERFNTPVVLDERSATRLCPDAGPGQRVEVHGRAVGQDGTRYVIVSVGGRRGERRMRSVSEFGDTAVAGWRW